MPDYDFVNFKPRFKVPSVLNRLWSLVLLVLFVSLDRRYSLIKLSSMLSMCVSALLSTRSLFNTVSD